MSRCAASFKFFFPSIKQRRSVLFSAVKPLRLCHVNDAASGLSLKGLGRFIRSRLSRVEPLGKVAFSLVVPLRKVQYGDVLLSRWDQ